MDDVERVLAEHACAKLCTRFHNLVDAGRNVEIMDLFHHDALWRHRTGDLRGHREIAAYLREKSTFPVTRHVLSNILIDVEDNNTARGELYLTVYYGLPQASEPAILDHPVLIVHYSDTFARTDNGWRFMSRQPKPIFRHESARDMIHSRADEAARGAAIA